MIVVDSVTKFIKVVLGGAVVANQPHVVATYADLVQAPNVAYPPVAVDTLTNGATPVTVIAGPSVAGVKRKMQFLSVFNADTAVVTVTVQYVSGANTRNLIKVPLAIGDLLFYTEDEGWQVTLASGAASSSGGVSDNMKKDCIEFIIRGYSEVQIVTGVAGYVRVPYACTITRVNLLAD